MSKGLKIAFAIATSALLSSHVESCVDPIGLDSDPGVPTEGVFLSFVFATFDEALVYETPIQFRLIALDNVPIFNSRTAFYANVLDSWGRRDVSDSRRRCLVADGGNATLLEIHERVTFAYATYFGFLEAFPEAEADLKGVLSSFNLDPDICDNNDCLDESLIGTPWGLAYTCAKESSQFFATDGFNADGSLSREYNKIPYEDFRDRPYVPQNSPWELTKKRRWQPLLESDELGFLFYQEHVVPHIGFTGKSFYLGDDYICNARAVKPRYKYKKEMHLAIERTANLDDTKKALIEYFDIKPSSLFPLMIQQYVRQGFSDDSWELLQIDFITVLTVYEATLLVWKEKVRYDAVRPTSIIQDQLEGETVTSYAGTSLDGDSFGTQTFLADDWEPYIRTMPHAEYPSASACQCTAFANAIIEFTGVDDITSLIGGPLIVEIPAGSSRIENGTPENDVVLAFSSWTEIAEACGQSRLDGGMHFTAAVPGGADLCADVGITVARTVTQLLNGEDPSGYIVDFDDDSIPNRKCK